LAPKRGFYTQIEHLFSQALGIVAPWKISTVSFNSEKKRLDIYVDFERGALFSHEDEVTGEEKRDKAYDTVEKTWRHLNFFEYELLNCSYPAH
jgi:transposase